MQLFFLSSNVSEMIIFLFLGVSLYDHSVQNWDWGLSLWTVFFSFLYRPIGKTATTSSICVELLSLSLY